MSSGKQCSHCDGNSSHNKKSEVEAFFCLLQEQKNYTVMFYWVIGFCHYGMNLRIFSIVSASSIGYQLIIPYPQERVREVIQVFRSIGSFKCWTISVTATTGKTIAVIQVKKWRNVHIAYTKYSSIAAKPSVRSKVELSLISHFLQK
jgi:hypothetical protein